SGKSPAGSGPRRRDRSFVASLLDVLFPAGTGEDLAPGVVLDQLVDGAEPLHEGLGIGELIGGPRVGADDPVLFGLAGGGVLDGEVRDVLARVGEDRVTDARA